MTLYYAELNNTSFSNAQFESAVAVLRSLGANVKTYLMIKPPFLDDSEAIQDSVDSLRYLRDLGLQTATLCPTRVAKNTLAHRLFLRELYQPPNLWSIVEVIRRASADIQLRVACINLRGSDFDSIFPYSCPQCADAIVTGLEHFSLCGALDNLPSACRCRPRNKTTMSVVDAELLAPRVRAMLSQLREDVCRKDARG
jgi:archaeosine synthase beta-subunit